MNSINVQKMVEYIAIVKNYNPHYIVRPAILDWRVQLDQNHFPQVQESICKRTSLVSLLHSLNLL
jgi:hypothetical protein